MVFTTSNQGYIHVYASPPYVHTGRAPTYHRSRSRCVSMSPGLHVGSYRCEFTLYVGLRSHSLYHAHSSGSWKKLCLIVSLFASIDRGLPRIDASSNCRLDCSSSHDIVGRDEVGRAAFPLARRMPKTSTHGGRYGVKKLTFVVASC